jgi:hypothetical protein
MTETVITDAQLFIGGLLLLAAVLAAVLVRLYRDQLGDLNLLDRLDGLRGTASKERPDKPIVGYDEDIKRQVEIALTLAGRDLLGNPDLSWADVRDVITWDQILAYLEDLDRRVSSLEQLTTSPPAGGLAPP